MYGQPPHFRPGGGGSGTAQSPQQQQVHLNPNLFPNPNCFLPQQIPNFLPQLNPFFQNPNSFPQIHQEFPNTNYPVQLNADYNNFQPQRPNGNTNSTFPQQHGTVQKDQNPISFPQIHQPFPNNNYPVQLNADYNSFQPQRPNGNNNSTLPEQHGKVQKEMVEKLDKAAVKARKDLMKSNDNVSAWKVSKAALLAVKAESWESLGFQIHQVPSLNSLLVTEGEINAFIHCFVAVRRITSLYDLEVAICESEGVKQFEELELGPLVRHPLVVHYFSVSSNLSEVYRIRTEEIIDYLYEFTCAHKKKEIKVDSFLDFISEKQSVSSREVLCVRVQNLGLYLNLIKQARQSDDNVLEKCYDKMRTTIGKRRKKRPLFSAQKKEMDENFVSISQRMKSFSSVSTQFCGKHIRFMSSSSEDEDSEASDYEDNQDQKNTDSKYSLSLPNGRAQRVGSCPYPSADEEMRRLGLKSDLESMSCTPDGSARRRIDNELSRKKRRYENISSSAPLPRKVPKKDKFAADLKHKGSGNEDMGGHSLSIESLKMFVTTWKDACRRSNADEVLDMMLQFYNSRRKKKVKEMFGSYPFVGLLYAAVTCIKLGLWDNMYDTLQTFGQACVDDKTIESSADYISIDVESAKKDVQGREPLTHKQDVMSEDIVLKIAGYFEDDVLTCKSPSRENRIHFLRKLCKCEYWLIQQFSVDKFESLGYGEYFLFLEKYMERIPPLQKYIIGDISENVSLEAHLLPIQLDVLLSQAATGLCESETINMRNISELLARQFPLVCFKLVSSDPMANFPDVLRERRFNLESNSVLFSTPLARLTYMGDSLSQNEKKVEETSECANNRLTREGSIAAVTTRDAIKVLLQAPMLTDLNLWSHWDILYAPSLGSIVGWLLKEVNTKELRCLVTKDGKVIRVDPLAATDSFLKVLIQESSFETAVQLLSLFVLYGGDRSVPLSLLKCHARQAFEVILNNYSELNLHSDGNPIMCGKISGDQHIVGKITSRNLHSKLLNDKSVLNKAARFILDCLSYLPIEFCSFAADVLIAGLQSFVNNVPAAILAECKRTDQRLMLHEVGLSLGVYEWVNDYQSFCASASTRSSSELSCLDVVNSELNASPIVEQGELVMHTTSSGEMLVSSEVDHHDQDKSVSARANPVKVSVSSPTAYPKQLSVLDNHIDNDPAKIIESIRKEEFGLDQSLSATENSMLEKQHARLGRALHCLSQELYSQDSHFILELVQNADDNIYLGNVEPTLTFILQERGIIVLNNEQGFSSSNIKALCDVGNSTKKGLNAGYIGKKGIGFKSVFRVTDAPEIHSNGFHIKFDITEGQIGFVLPTVVSPCDIDMYAKLAANGDQLGENSWKTCIVLPFRSNLLEGYAMNNILSMFSDLHPSLLLFLHRLQCIKFRNLLDDSLVVMRKRVVGDGIVEVAHGNQKMTWFVASKKLKADIIRSDVETTEISLAFTLEETGEEGYASILNQQPVFSFLPLRTYGLKFILQGDFVLPSSREEVDGNNPWNQWLLSEFPDLFVSAERSFCALPCYKISTGKAITVFMSFVPLVGEVHGFFSSLPRRIISKLRMSNCLILDGDEKQWVPPCKVLRNWTDQARSLLPDVLLHEHLGLGFLDKDIVLSDSLAKALGVEDYGSTTLFRVMSSLCRSDDGLKSMGLGWLASWLNTVCVMSSQLSIQSSTSSLTESDFILNLQRTPFIPLSDGKYSCVAEGTIWLASETVDQGINDECLLKAFPKLYAKLRIVSPGLLAAAASIGSSCPDIMILQNVARMLYKVGVQKLSIHDIVKLQIFPAISDIKNALGQEELMIEYLAFAMFHLQSSCTTCSLEKGPIIAELHDKALILTNFGFKRLNEVPIHFSKEYGNPVDVDKLVSGLDMRWHEIDAAYMRHPITKSVSGGVLKWRNFFQEIGVTDFVQVVEVNKSVPEMSLVNPKDLLQDKGMTSTDSVKNWESEELLHLLSSLSSREDREKSKYLLEILDSLWDDYFSNKVSGSYIDVAGKCKPCKSSLIRILEDFPWVASNINTKLHYPKDLFHDCVAVNSIFGVSAPYTIPKVRSEKLLADIGLKTQVTLDNALSVLRIWRKSESHFNASVSQMSNFYSFLWKGLTHSKKKVIEELLSGPFIFVPKTSIYSEEDALYGSLLSPQEVYWHDSIGSMDQIKPGHLEGVSKIPCSPQRKMLRNFYPNLHDFFVNECGVVESPPLSSYLQILLQLSATALPHQAAKRVFDVLLIWDAALKIGSMSVEDVEYLKESLLKKEYTVLPTRQDKWVSLHSSFGLICWCDDDNLGREFKHLGGVDFLFFGESTDEDNQMLAARVSVIMQRLGVPSLSEVVTREVISYGPADSNFFFSLVNWVLPYAQRYIHDAQPDKYFQLKQTGFENLRNLKIVVVEKLFYRNKIKKCEITSKKRHQCNCLLQENILYCLRESDPHSIFLELSRLLFNGTPELHFANFLHMITIMAKSGATEEQTELFILNSQRVPKLPSDEPTWSLQPPSSFMDYNATLPENCHILRVEELNSLLVKRKPVIKSNWPPADWKTAPGFNPLYSSGFRTPGSSTLRIVEGNNAEKDLEQIDISPDSNSNEFNNEADTTAITQGAVLVEPEILESHSSLSSNLMTSSSMNIALDSVDLVSPDIKNVGPSGSTERDQVSAQQALLTGRLGELVAFKFFVGKVGEQFVKWVNETNETGLPYDIVVEGDETSKEYIEVKATKYGRKNWFLISMREWQFAVENGESFSIAHVVLADDNMARVTIYKNPARLCQTGNLKLAFVVPKQ